MNYIQALHFARKLRNNQTKTEVVFWKNVRNRKFHGFKFNRQFLICYKLLDKKSKYFIVDFYCHNRKLIIEIDGNYHLFQREHDLQREIILNSYGYKLLRFTNEEILSSWKDVQVRLLQALKK